MLLPGLKFLRHATGLSQIELSEKSGVSRDAIQKLEAGDRPARPATVKKLAGALGVEAGALAEEKGSRDVDEQTTITVPAFYPMTGNADILKRWDDSEEAWLYASLENFRDRAIAETVARASAELGEDADIPGIMAFLWLGFGEAEDAAEFIEAHKDLIQDRVREIREQEAG